MREELCRMVSRLTNNSFFGTFRCLDSRFSGVHLDIVGRLPPPKSFRYLLTCVDRFRRWPEVFSRVDQTPDITAEVFLFQLVPRCGIPSVIIADQECQFESQLFEALCKLLDITRSRTCTYNLIANCLVDRRYRHFQVSC